MAPRTLSAVLVVLLLSVLATPGGAVVPEQQVVAGPGAWVSTYATPVVAVPQDGALLFTNGDIMAHNVESDAHGTDDAPWCARYLPGRCPLFWSATVGIGVSTPVMGLEHLEPGTVYGFYCDLHPGMTGNLVALPPTGSEEPT